MAGSAAAAGCADTCSALSAGLGEPLPGTAAVAPTWLCLEQRGPWGPDALHESRLDPDVGAAIAGRAAAAGIRVQLIRRPGRHPDTGPGTARQVYLARTHPREGWLRTTQVAAPDELLDLDFDALARGDHQDWGRHAPEPVLLVCTNGRRDLCCAVHGRTLIAELGPRHAGVVWETTHTGGHRFAPAAVVLPSGYTYGRFDARLADAVLSSASAGKVVLDHCRGRATWSQPAQAAELAVRARLGEHLADAVDVLGEHDGVVRIAHQDGRRWEVTTRTEHLHPARPSSCGKAAGHPATHHVERIDAE
ncbi:sucrase ferredoxin [Allosaccharopolyspora coralli]|uniref:Sucrase ferredoxin n=1 Tax=Allosaccharopolyspora coralli TaxID=2665642 RepID=A0A5Q3QMP5_9PSEU|nr:sucrase ferredoxin [Allosaccharopolyspora coralli]